MNPERPHPYVFSQAAPNGKRGVHSRIVVIIRARSKVEAIQKFTRWRKDSAQENGGFVS